MQLARKEGLDLLREDPRLVAKYAATAALLSFIGKSIMIGAHAGADMPTLYAQFTPTVPMLLINFTVYKYLWKQPQLRLRSQVGKKWTKAYGAEFVIGHALLTLFAVKLGMNYVVVSTAIGLATSVVTFALNTWILGRGPRVAADPAPSSLAP